MGEEHAETVTEIDNKMDAMKNLLVRFSVSFTHSYLWLGIFPVFLSIQNIVCA